MWHTEESEEEVLDEIPEVMEEASNEEHSVPDEEEQPKDSKKPEYKDYKTWAEIPEKERKHYGI